MAPHESLWIRRGRAPRGSDDLPQVPHDGGGKLGLMEGRATRCAFALRAATMGRFSLGRIGGHMQIDGIGSFDNFHADPRPLDDAHTAAARSACWVVRRGGPPGGGGGISTTRTVTS